MVLKWARYPDPCHMKLITQNIKYVLAYTFRVRKQLFGIQNSLIHSSDQFAINH